MPSPPTSTSFAILGLLGLQSWTAYELVAQMQRNMAFWWPRSAAHLYAELKRIVERGHATAEQEEGRRRQRTRYTITAEGREALEAWLRTEPAPPIVEIEAVLRMFFADQGTAEDLRNALEATVRHVRELDSQGRAVIEDVLETGGPFPERVHLAEPVGTLLDDMYGVLAKWCENMIAEIDEWSSTRDVGQTARARERLQQLLARPAL